MTRSQYHLEAMQRFWGESGVTPVEQCKTRWEAVRDRSKDQFSQDPQVMALTDFLQDNGIHYGLVLSKSDSEAYIKSRLQHEEAARMILDFLQQPVEPAA